MVVRRLKSKEESTVQHAPAVDVAGIVKGVIDNIGSNGDAAVRQFSQQFDSWSPEDFKLSAKQIDDIIASVDPQIIQDIKEVQGNVRTFAEKQKAALHEFELEIQPGVFLGQKNNPIERVGW